MSHKLSRWLFPLIAALISNGAYSQAFPYYGPSNGILYGSSTSGFTRSATASDLAALISCATTQIVYTNSSGALICSSNLTWSDSALMLTLGSPSAGTVSMSSGTGDAFTFVAGAAASGVGTGPAMTVIAGAAGTTATNNTGGAASVKGANGGSGGTNATGGAAAVTAGSGGSGSTSANGAVASVNGGSGGTAATANGGQATVNGGSGNGSATGNGGSASMTGGSGGSGSSTTANGGNANITAGAGGNSAATTANGGSVNVTAGAAGTSAATANGGNINLKPGAASSLANAGQVILQTSSGTNVLIADPFGNVYCACATGTSATDGFLYLGVSSGTPTGTPTHTSGSYASSVPVRYDTSNDNLWVYSGAWRSAVQAQQTITFQPGLLSTIITSPAAFSKFVKASTVDNIEASALSFTCSTNPTITLYECSTSNTCTSPATIGTVTLTTTGQVFDGSISSPGITAGDYVAWDITAGSCTALNIAATAQVHAN